MSTITEALRAARACIQQDRTSLADTGMRPDNTMEPDAAAGVAEYDAVLQQIDAALAGMTHHITDEQIGQIAEQVGLVGPASRVGDCHAASLRFARALLDRAAPAPQGEPVSAALSDIVALWDLDAPLRYNEALHMQAKRALAGEQPASPDLSRWCVYVAGMISGWLEMARPQIMSMGDEARTQAIARIIERRLWSMPKDTAPAPAVPSGWSITANDDDSITVTGPLKIRCTVSDDEPYGARMFGDVLHALCRDMLTAAPTPSRAPAVPSDELTIGMIRVMTERPNRGLDIQFRLKRDADWPGQWRVSEHYGSKFAKPTARWYGSTLDEALVQAIADGGVNSPRAVVAGGLMVNSDGSVTPAKPISEGHWRVNPDRSVTFILEQSAALTAAPTPPAQTGIRAEFLDAHIKRTTNTVGRMVAETADQRGADAVAEFVRRAMQHVVSLIDATPPAQPAVPEDVARDAERYRWLRSRPLDWSVEHHTNGWSTCYGLMELDAAIDAARAAEKGGA